MIFLIPIFLTIISLHANELQWVDEQINAIKPPRSGLSETVLLSLKDPFIFLNSTKDINISKKTILIPKIKVKKKITKISKKTIKKVKPKKLKIKKIKQKVYYTSKYITLNAIMNNSALINNRWYKIGSKVSKFTLKSISASSIVLIRKNVKLILSTKSNFKKLNFKK